VSDSTVALSPDGPAPPGTGPGDAAARRQLIRSTSARSLVRRHLVGRVAVALCLVAVAISLAPLVALVAYTTSRGIHALSIDFFTQSNPPGGAGSGIANAIVGSLIIVGLAAVMAVPWGS
jgi:phosphate transport system permease protein